MDDRIHIRIDTATKQRIVKAAKKQKTQLSTWIRQACLKELKRQEKREKEGK